MEEKQPNDDTNFENVSFRRVKRIYEFDSRIRAFPCQQAKFGIVISICWFLNNPRLQLILVIGFSSLIPNIQAAP